MGVDQNLRLKLLGLRENLIVHFDHRTGASSPRSRGTKLYAAFRNLLSSLDSHRPKNVRFRPKRVVRVRVRFN